MARRRRPSRRQEGHRTNRYAHLRAPQAVLDFHGLGPLSGSEVKRRTLAFLAGARRAGRERVRIVTGRGLHSSGEPLVRPQVLRTLAALEREGEIAGYQSAPVTEGGDGAIDVRLG